MSIQNIGIKVGAWAFVGVLFFGAFGKPWVNVSNGSVGVETSFGKVVGCRSPGLQGKLPWHSVTEISTWAKKLEDKAEAPSKDLQEMNFQISGQYQILPAGCADLYLAFGTQEDIEKAVLVPGMQEVSKAVSANYTSTELLLNLDKVGSEARDALADWVKQSFADRKLASTVDVSALLFNNAHFSKTFEDATLLKANTESMVGTAQRDRDREVTKAQGEAAAIIRDGQAQSKQIRLQADAEANGMLEKAKALKEHPDLPCYLVHKNWDGVMPEVSTGGNPLPFADACKK